MLDFGLAKALSDEPPLSDASQSPTLSAVATRAGMLLGTAAYMSPEQAKSKEANRRSDIWSFGVVLFEMLSGHRLYSGETAAETLAAVLKTEPDWSVLPGSVPPGIRRLMRRCLEKDARRRVQAIGEARIALEDALAGASQAPLTTHAAGADRAHAKHALPWLLAAVTSLVAIGLWSPWRDAPQPKPALRLSVELGADASLFVRGGSTLALSSDGALLAFAARDAGGRQQLYLRRLPQLQASPLAGTDDAVDPFFSPDGRWIAFFAGGRLKKTSVTGGSAVTLADAPMPRGGTWSEDGTIVFAPDSAGGLLQVSAAGGRVETLTQLDTAAGDVTHRWPQALPGGKALLYTSHDLLANYEDASIVVRSLPEGRSKVVHRGGFHGRYLPSGHLAYVHEGTLCAAPFDLNRLDVRGPAVPMVEGVANASSSAMAQFAFSRGGTLVYAPGGTFAVHSPIDWMDRDGKAERLRAVPADYRSMRFSPDGARLALEVSDGRRSQIWIYEWTRDRMSRLTPDAIDDRDPVWTPDGRRIAFVSTQADKTTLHWTRADGTGEPERLTEGQNTRVPTSWHPGGRILAFEERSRPGNSDLMILELQGDEMSGFKPEKARVFLESPSQEVQAAFSPDGRWLAYASDASGRSEIYVRPFPGPGGTWQVSTGGGQHPVWSSKRAELYYRSPEPQIMVARYSVEGSTFRADKPVLWSPGRFTYRPTWRNFDLHPDGHRAAVLGASAEEPPTQDKVVLFLEFDGELRRLAPAR